MSKLYMQTDSQGFFIEPTYNNFEGAIDTKEPVFDKELEMAKWNGTEWEIKTIQEWKEIENLKLKEQKLIFEKENKKQQILNELDKIDLQSIRPNRNINIGIGTDFDRNKLIELEEKAKKLRLELSLI